MRCDGDYAKPRDKHVDMVIHVWKCLSFSARLTLARVLGDGTH